MRTVHRPSSVLLMLGMHGREGYCSLSVCLSVTNLVPAYNMHVTN